MEDQKKTAEGAEEAHPGKARNLEARAEALKKFNELEGRVVSEEAPAEASKLADGVQSKSDTEPAADKKGESKADAETPKAEVKKEPITDEKPKMVPLEALHEAREKLKARTLEARQKDAAIEAMQKEIAEIKANLNKPKVEQKADADPEKAELRKQLQALQSEFQKTQVNEAQKAQEAENNKFQNTVKKVNSDLNADGYPGFEVAIAAVNTEITRRFNEGDLTVEECKSPDVWKAVYKETVFPTLENGMEERKRRLTTDSKIAAKKKANLVANPGSKPDDNEDDKPEFTPETYFKKRRTLA